MPRKRRIRRDPSPLWVLPVLALAVAAGWYLLRPLPHPKPHRHSTVGVATAAPTETPAPSPRAFASATLTPPPTPLASAPTPGAAPTSSAAPFHENAPRLALIVDDCGQWLDTERAFIALPIPLTLSVLPNVHGTATIAREAAAAGKGVMLHLPMETLSGLYPGPGEITTKMSDAEIVAQVDADLAQVPQAAGVNNHEGSKASADPRVMQDVIEALKAHGSLFFIDSRTNSASVGEEIAERDGVATAARDVFLDNRRDVAYVEDQLREAMTIAKRTGRAIAIGHPRPTTLEALRAMIPELDASGIRLVLAQNLTH
jgi:polysaccharide deacetylase 2 family uncharacterized protein YibQ